MLGAGEHGSAASRALSSIILAVQFAVLEAGLRLHGGIRGRASVPALVHAGSRGRASAAAERARPVHDRRVQHRPRHQRAGRARRRADRPEGAPTNGGSSCLATRSCCPSRCRSPRRSGERLEARLNARRRRHALARDQRRRAGLRSGAGMAVLRPHRLRVRAGHRADRRVRRQRCDRGARHRALADGGPAGEAAPSRR